MSELVRCPTCNGLKAVIGMGGMKKDCADCGKIGWIRNASAALSDSSVISPSELDQVKADLQKMIEAYQELKKENESLKTKLHKLKIPSETPIKNKKVPRETTLTYA